MKRYIAQITKRERSSLLRLSCGHLRSVGGHRFANGHEPRVHEGYDCQDGTCCEAVTQ